jgi:hypothetical protein
MEQPIFPAIYQSNLIPHLLAGRGPGMRAAESSIKRYQTRGSMAPDFLPPIRGPGIA